jgi:integration host factor subunit alpha
MSSLGKEVKLAAFGNFELKEKGPRPGRNRRSGQLVTITARQVVTFRASQNTESKG